MIIIDENVLVDENEDMENEDIADILAEVGISAKGKRETLIDKLVKAVREGLVEFDEEDEEVDDEEDDIEEAPVSADSEDDEDDEEDNINDFMISFNNYI